MSNEAVILSLISTLLGGGVLGAIIKELFARGKTLAEEKKSNYSPLCGVVTRV
jgi:hypothetical protein